MYNFICWICKVNTVYRDYKGKELLDEDGSKPCIECLLESENEKAELEKELEL